MKQEELNSILELHRKWLYNEPGGKRADLSGADLSGANLSRADLSRADLSGADLSGADLSRADLSRADLSGADLSGADLSRADLSGADLSGADLSRAINASLIFAKTCICPQEGSFIAWKQARYYDEEDNSHYCIIKLEIPADAKRSNASTRKCRASKARVIEIQEFDGNRIDGNYRVVSFSDPDFVYLPGATVEPTEPFDEDRWNECASGIHFFITREEAVDW